MATNGQQGAGEHHWRPWRVAEAGALARLTDRHGGMDQRRERIGGEG